MPRRTHRKYNLRGGSLSEWWGSVQNSASNFWGSASNWVKSKTGETTSYSQQSQPYLPESRVEPQPRQYLPPQPVSSQRAGKRTRRVKRGGGFADNISLTNLASSASPFSGPTAQPHNWVGGKSRKHRKQSKRRRR
jgi:hypothetical protein